MFSVEDAIALVANFNTAFSRYSLSRLWLFFRHDRHPHRQTGAWVPLPILQPRVGPGRVGVEDGALLGLWLPPEFLEHQLHARAAHCTQARFGRLLGDHARAHEVRFESSATQSDQGRARTWRG